MGRQHPSRTTSARRHPTRSTQQAWWRRVIALERLPARWRGLTHELAKFGTIGVINLFVNFAVLNLLILTVLRNGELKAKAIAAIVATTSAYFMNRHWTYRDRPKSTLRREYSLFFFFNLVGMVIEVAVVGFAKYGLHQTHLVAVNVSTAIGIGLGTLFRFWAYRTHVFKTELNGTAASAAATTTAATAQADPPATGAQSPGEGASIDEIELDGMVTLTELPAEANS